MQCNKKTIWSFKQNKPSYVVNDIITKYPDIDPNFIYKVLLQRGIFKWLSVRRDLIKLKNTMRDEITQLNRKKTIEEKGYYKALLASRKAIRKLCHSDRWVAPDFDLNANKYLTKIETLQRRNNE